MATDKQPEPMTDEELEQIAFRNRYCEYGHERSSSDVIARLLAEVRRCWKEIEDYKAIVDDLHVAREAQAARTKKRQDWDDAERQRLYQQRQERDDAEMNKAIAAREREARKGILR